MDQKNKKHIRTLSIFFDTDISLHEVPLFRGGTLNILGEEANLLFHNHEATGKYRYSYPLIQYKRLHGKAAIVSVDEGVDIIGHLLSKYEGTIKIGERIVPIHISKIVPAKILVQTWKEPINYHISNWLPLNAKNFLLFQNLNDEQEKLDFLSKILQANILSMLKGFGIMLSDELTVKIKWLSEPRVIRYKGIGLTSFNANFSCNLSIPNNLGIGKSASMGFGVVYQKRPEKTEETEEVEL